MLVVYAVAHFVLTRTTFGRYVYAIGGNEEATRLSGVAVRFHKTMIYGVSGLMSAVAAIILTARLNSAQPIAGMMYELDAIAATVIGGTSLMGGEGSLGGTLVGALIMGVLRNGLNLLGVSSFPSADRDRRRDRRSPCCRHGVEAKAPNVTHDATVTSDRSLVAARRCVRAVSCNRGRRHATPATSRPWRSC